MILPSTPLYTLHSHTQFCDGHAPMAEFAAEASRRGFELYGFTPHSPVPIESPCNMKAADVPVYLKEVKRLRGEYPDVKFLAGMEVDFLGDEWGPHTQYFHGLGLDYIIGSVHFIPTQDGRLIDIDGNTERFSENMRLHFHNDIRYVVETFFRQSIRMVESGGFDIIGHFDKIKHNAGQYHPGVEREPWYEEGVNQLIEAIIDSGVIVEINTKAWRDHQQLFPAQRHWKRLMEAGVTIVVNSDAHRPELIDASRAQVLRALSYLRGVRSLAHNRCQASVSLRKEP